MATMKVTAATAVLVGVMMILEGCAAAEQKTEYGCENKDVTLTCPDGEAIAIDYAFYGSRKGSDAAKYCAEHYDQDTYKHNNCGNFTFQLEQAKRWVQFQYEFVFEPLDYIFTKGKIEHFVSGAGCEGANFCKFKANNAITGGKTGIDPCKGSHKHAIIKYKCETKGTHLSELVSEYTETNVVCPIGQTISVHHPVVFKSTECADNPLEQGKAYEAVNEECEGQQICKFKARVDGQYTNDHFADVCKGKTKQLQFRYSCGTSVVKCDGEESNVNIQCPTNTEIIIKSAFYGRDSEAVCRHEYYEWARSGGGGILCNECGKWWDSKTEKFTQQISQKFPTGCGTSQQQRDDAKEKLKARCDGQINCEIEANKIGIFGDPCKDVRKYLRFEYDCMQTACRLPSGSGGETEHTTCIGQEHDTFKIECDGGEKIKIHSVEYKSDVCPNDPLEGSAALKGISELCEDKESCEFKVGNHLPHFNVNVCPGQLKQLTVDAKCVKMEK